MEDIRISTDDCFCCARKLIYSDDTVKRPIMWCNDCGRGDHPVGESVYVRFRLGLFCTKCKVAETQTLTRDELWQMIDLDPDVHFTRCETCKQTFNVFLSKYFTSWHTAKDEKDERPEPKPATWYVENPEVLTPTA